jgi:hypothetical protein
VGSIFSDVDISVVQIGCNDPLDCSYSE